MPLQLIANNIILQDPEGFGILEQAADIRYPGDGFTGALLQQGFVQRTFLSAGKPGSYRQMVNAETQVELCLKRSPRPDKAGARSHIRLTPSG